MGHWRSRQVWCSTPCTDHTIAKTPIRKYPSWPLCYQRWTYQRFRRASTKLRGFFGLGSNRRRGIWDFSGWIWSSFPTLFLKQFGPICFFFDFEGKNLKIGGVILEATGVRTHSHSFSIKNWNQNRYWRLWKMLTCRMSYFVSPFKMVQSAETETKQNGKNARNNILPMIDDVLYWRPSRVQTAYQTSCIILSIWKDAGRVFRNFYQGHEM